MVKTDIDLLLELVTNSGSQKEAAKRLAISDAALSNYANGNKPIGPSLREKLRALGYTAQEDDGVSQIKELRTTVDIVMRTYKHEIEVLESEVEQKSNLLREKQELYNTYKDMISRLDKVTVETLRHTVIDDNEQSIPLVTQNEKNVTP